MIYSIIVWGFDNDNDYQHDCDLIKAKSFKEAKEDAYSYINRFHNISPPTLMEVYRA